MAIPFDSANSWGWYEMCKRERVQDLAHLIVASGMLLLPPEAIEGFGEWQIARRRMENNRHERF